MRSRRLPWFLCLLALIACVASGCVTSEAAPQLLNILDFVPREAEQGDRL
jgi:hypothetical protein